MRELRQAEPFADGWFARRATFVEERGQRFTITVAAPDDSENQAGLRLLAAGRRVYRQADPVEQVTQKGAQLAEQQREMAESEETLRQSLEPRKRDGRAIAIDRRLCGRPGTLPDCSRQVGL